MRLASSRLGRLSALAVIDSMSGGLVAACRQRPPLVVPRSRRVLVVEIVSLWRIPEPADECMIEVAGKGDHRADRPGRCKRDLAGTDCLVEAAEPGQGEREAEMGEREPRRVLTRPVATIGAVVGGDHFAGQSLGLAVLRSEER